MAQLEKLPEIGALRRRNHGLLQEVFAKYENYFHLPSATLGADPDWFAYALTIKDDAPFTRSEFCTFLESRRVQTRPYFAGNIMLQPAYADLVSSEEIISAYPIARKVTTDTFFLGCSPVITPDKIEYISQTVTEFMERKSW